MRSSIVKNIVLENIWNKEKVECSPTDLKNPEIIEGVEYVRVTRMGNVRVMLMRKDALKKVTIK
jgi:hypothetical protein